MKSEEVLIREAEYRVVRESLGLYLIDLVIVPGAGLESIPEPSPAACLQPKAPELQVPEPEAPDNPPAVR